VNTLCLQRAQACTVSVGVREMFRPSSIGAELRSHSKRLELPDEWGGNWMAGEVNQSKSCDWNIL